VASARAAFEDGRWSGKAPAERKRVLIRFADLMLAHKDELALLETLDMGKPIRYSRSVDVQLAQNCIRWYGEAIDKIYDEIAPTAQDSLALIQREPVGVVAAIIPWNYPMLMAAWKIGPALAAGNSLVLKPSEKAPLTRCAWPSWRWKPACRKASSTSCPATATKPGARSACTWTSTASPSPAPRASASRSCRWRGSRT
jgi:acyl-CoA reductase-like NAD-dependent aldehyde dehydrogenase